LILFFFTLIFGVGIQVFYILEEDIIFPIDLSCIILYFVISFFELMFLIYAFVYIGNRQSALFKLRNSPVSNQNKREKIKTSKEIEQELFFKFPYLRKGNKNDEQNEHLKKN
jgi:hypothetical protein